MKHALFFWAVITICSFLTFYLPALISAEILILEGREQSLFVLQTALPPDISIPHYANYGYTQIPLKSSKVRVYVTIDPLQEEIAFSVQHKGDDQTSHNRSNQAFDSDNRGHSQDLKAGKMPSKLVTIARSLAKNKNGLAEVVNAIMIWIAKEITYSEQYAPHRDALSVLERGWGNCVDMSNLAQQLLRTLDIRCRLIHGLVFKESFERILPAPESPSGRFHRWIEVYFPDYGWIFYDPAFSCGFIRSDYLVLFIEESPLTFPEMLVEQDFIKIAGLFTKISGSSDVFITDCIESKGRTLISRRFSTNQHSCSLYGKVVFDKSLPRFMRDKVSPVPFGQDLGKILIQKEKEDTLNFSLNAHGVYSAYCLAPGSYSVILKFGERYYPMYPIRLLPGEAKRMDFTISKSMAPPN
ncbi:transglutaminase family protein [candidate division CSSED10-310 bacterium]|uniref:Transglutaminase family protein n=1 Tax=candidate division CSSED10-310 bacterium TaxID=2855610 RepID=A0ABV6YSN6_UNCC1